MAINYNLVDFGPPPRRVKWTGGKKLRIVVYALIAAVAGMIIGISYSRYTIARQLYQHGKVTSASIITKHYTQGKTRTYFFDLFYLDGLKSYSPDLEVSALDYDHYTQGNEVTVTFLPSDHDKIALGKVTAGSVQSSFHGLIVTVVVALLVGGWLLGMLERSLWREYRLVENGLIFDAVVESVEPYTVKGTAYLRVRYRFDVDEHSIHGMYSVAGQPASGPLLGATVRVIASTWRPTVNKPVSQIAFVGLA